MWEIFYDRDMEPDEWVEQEGKRAETVMRRLKAAAQNGERPVFGGATLHMKRADTIG